MTIESRPPAATDGRQVVDIEEAAWPLDWTLVS
jgi:hypothetical protein